MKVNEIAIDTAFRHCTDLYTSVVTGSVIYDVTDCFYGLKTGRKYGKCEPGCIRSKRPPPKRPMTVIVEEIKAKIGWNHAHYDTSMKFGMIVL